MKKLGLILASSILASSSYAQSIFLYFPQKLPLVTFEACSDVQESAKVFTEKIPNRVYFMELFPSGQNPLFRSFFSDVGGFMRQALGSLSAYPKEIVTSCFDRA